MRKYYSTSSTSSYVCTRRHVGNSQKRNDIDGAKNGEKWQMLLNVGPTFSDMLPTCCPTRQCCIKIGDADIRQTQLRSSEPPSPGKITSVPILLPGIFVEVSPPFVTSDSGSCWFSVPVSGSGPCLVWSFASISKLLWQTSVLSNAFLEGSQPSVKLIHIHNIQIRYIQFRVKSDMWYKL